MLLPGHYSLQGALRHVESSYSNPFVRIDTELMYVLYLKVNVDLDPSNISDVQRQQKGIMFIVSGIGSLIVKKVLITN